MRGESPTSLVALIGMLVSFREVSRGNSRKFAEAWHNINPDWHYAPKKGLILSDLLSAHWERLEADVHACPTRVLKRRALATTIGAACRSTKHVARRVWLLKGAKS
jgi:hypothetical protein